MTKFFVLIDFSDVGDQLVLLASKFADAEGAEVHFVHQFTSTTPSLVDPQTRAAADQVIRREFEQAMNELIAPLFSSKVKYFVHFIDEDVCTYLEKHGGESGSWALMGLRGTNPIKRIFFGGTALKVAASFKGPIIALPPQAQATRRDHLVVAIQKQEAHEAIAKCLHVLARQFGQVHLVTGIQSESSRGGAEMQLGRLRQELSQGAAADGLVSTHVFLGDHFAETIQRFLLSIQNPWLCLEKGAGSFWEEWLQKSLVKEYLQAASVPLILVPSSDASKES